MTVTMRPGRQPEQRPGAFGSAAEHSAPEYYKFVPGWRNKRRLPSILFESQIRERLSIKKKTKRLVFTYRGS